jgi:hypothetical protein
MQECVNLYVCAAILCVTCDWCFLDDDSVRCDYDVSIHVRAQVNFNHVSYFKKWVLCRRVIRERVSMISWMRVGEEDKREKEVGLKKRE